MGMILYLRMLSDENEAFLRDYHVDSDSSLADLHQHICEDLSFDEQAVVSFFEADGQWEKGEEYTLLDMGHEDGPITMANMPLGVVMQDKKDRLIYLFDMFAGRGLYLELMGAGHPEEGKSYPFTAKSEEDAPLQFAEENADELSIFDEALEEFNDFVGDDYYDDEY